MDLISVIVPIFNVDAYLYQCIQSIAGQTYPHLEILLVDDGSTDSAVEICEHFRKSDPRIRVVSKDNGGLVSARKAGLALATGTYTFYVDGDDWLEPDCIAEYHRLARAHDADMVIGDYKREFLGNYVQVSNRIAPGCYDRPRIEREILPRMISDGPFFNHGLRTYSWGKLYRTALVKPLQAAVPDEVIVCEDSALIYPAIQSATTVCIADFTLCNYRQRPNSILKSTAYDHREAGRIAAAFRYLAATLRAGQDRFGYLGQLQRYYAAIQIIRSGGFLGNAQVYEAFRIFGDLPEGAALAVYNSGSFGQHVYRQLHDNHRFRLSGWFDRDHHESRLLRMPVSNPDHLADCDFDFLLVASFDRTLLDEVDTLFQTHGLPPQKIRHVQLATDHLEDFIVATGFDPRLFHPLTRTGSDAP